MPRKNRYGVTAHSDGTISFWDIYTQSRRRVPATMLTAKDLETMTASERAKVLAAREQAQRQEDAEAREHAHTCRSVAERYDWSAPVQRGDDDDLLPEWKRRQEERAATERAARQERDEEDRREDGDE